MYIWKRSIIKSLKVERRPKKYTGGNIGSRECLLGSEVLQLMGFLIVEYYGQWSHTYESKVESFHLIWKILHTI